MHELGQGRAARRGSYPLHGERLAEVCASSQTESPRLPGSVAHQRHCEAGGGVRVGDGKASDGGHRHACAASSSSHETGGQKQAHQNTQTMPAKCNQRTEERELAARARLCFAAGYLRPQAAKRATRILTRAAHPLLSISPFCCCPRCMRLKVHPLGRAASHRDAPPRAPRAGTLQNRLDAHLPLWRNGMLNMPLGGMFEK
jgi:hypothetical protein